MGMRVIAGVYRHRQLKYPESKDVIRPTKDRIREAFFSSLGDISNKTFLDLYAGVGSMGIEAISRGVSTSYFVDKSEIAIKYIKDNIDNLNIKNAHIIFEEDIKALEEFKNKNIKFDIIYLDPPYETGKYEEILSYIYSSEILNKGAVVAFEAKRKIGVNPLWYNKIKEYHYGEITVTVLRN